MTILEWASPDPMEEARFVSSFGDFLHAHGIRNFTPLEIAPVGKLTGVPSGSGSGPARKAREAVQRALGRVLPSGPLQVALQAPPRELWPNCLPTLRVLEELRAATGGRPIDVSSFYRDPVYNAAVGGADGSQHTEMRAADFASRAWSRAKDRQWLEQHTLESTFGVGTYPTFTHFDTRGTRARWGTP